MQYRCSSNFSSPAAHSFPFFFCFLFSFLQTFPFLFCSSFLLFKLFRSYFVPLFRSSDFSDRISFLFSVLLSARHFLDGGVFRSIRKKKQSIFFRHFLDIFIPRSRLDLLKGPASIFQGILRIYCRSRDGREFLLQLQCGIALHILSVLDAHSNL